MRIEIIGLRGDASFDGIVSHFTSMGSEIVLMDPMQVYGKDMLVSAVEHAERAFSNGENSSKTVLTEIILYASGERQISKALSKMRPKEGCKEYVAIIIDPKEDLRLDAIGMVRDDSIVDGSPEKIESMGLNVLDGIDPEDLALERVALVDILKKMK